jgi:hypothetical protein
MDVEAALGSILAAERLFRAGFVSFMLTAVFFLLSAWALYALLRPVNKDLALLFVLLNLGGVSVWCMAQLGEFAALLLVSGAGDLQALQADQLRALAVLSLQLFQVGFMIAQLLLNLWLFPLGYLVLKSGFLPKVFGILLLVDGLAMLAWFLQFFLLPELAVIGTVSLAVGLVAEAPFCLWLSIVGVKKQKPALVEVG